MSVNTKPPARAIELRPATQEDAEQVAQCVCAAYSQWIERIGQMPWPMLQDYSAVVANQIVVVATFNTEIVGVLVLAIAGNELMIDSIAVLPSFEGQGIGKRLMSHAEHVAAAKNYSSMIIHTIAEMAEAIERFQRAGYQEVARRRERGLNRVFLRKMLPVRERTSRF
jgi:ribosomal protein S18 acetylase RimI-like enzyme